MNTETSTKSAKIPMLQDTTTLASKVTTPKLTTSSKFYSFSGFVQQRINVPLIIFGLIALLVFIGALIAVLVVVTTNRSKKNSKYMYDICVDRRLDCYKPKCFHRYIAKKTTTFDGQSCLPVRPPLERDYADGVCVKAANIVVPWCYVTSEPPFMRKPCYKFCDETEECMNKQLDCYNSDNPKCSGDQYAYKGHRNRFAFSTNDSSHPCSRSQGANSMPACKLTADSRAPWCNYYYVTKMDKIRFCHTSCGAQKYLKEFGVNPVYAPRSAAFPFRKYIIGSVINSFYGVHIHYCGTLCAWTPDCYYFWGSFNASGYCQLLHEVSKAEDDMQSYTGWRLLNDSIALSGGKLARASQKERVHSNNKIITIRFDDDQKIVEGEFAKRAEMRDPMKLLTGDLSLGPFVISYDRSTLYINLFKERGHDRFRRHDRTQNGKVVYGASVGAGKFIFMCGGLKAASSADPKVQQVDADCAIFDTRRKKKKFNKGNYSFNAKSKTFKGTPKKMLIPRIDFSMVMRYEVIFAFMGCRKPVENCTEMVKPIHYFVILYNEWRETGTDMQIERINYGYAVYKDKIYVCGGLNPANRSEILDNCEVYQLRLGKNYTVIPSNTAVIKGLPAKTQDFIMATIYDMLLAIGGRHSTDESNVTNAIYRYNDSDNSWTLFARMKYQMYGMKAASF